MNNLNYIRIRSSKVLAAIFAVVSLLFAITHVSAQTTNAYDNAADPAYPAGDLLVTNPNGGQNGGFGFGAWNITLMGTGGALIQNYGPSGRSFDIWNTSANSATIAVRPFNSPLVPGQSFSVQLRLNSLDNSGTTNALLLRDASGNTLFSYWHVGNEPNSSNGHYTDSATTDGAAVGFSYNYQQFCTFTFTLNSSTNYTFTDNTTGQSFSGTISGSVAQVAFFRGSLNSTGNGQDFQFDALQIVSGVPLTFSSRSPARGSYSAARTNLNVSVKVLDGSFAANTNSIVFQVDGNTLPPSATKSGGSTTISCTPAAPLSAGSVHTARIVLSDSNGNSYTNTWSFTTGFATLPATLPGPMSVTNNGTGLAVFTASGDDWLRSNYGSSSSKTVYARFSMEFDSVNGETGSGGAYGGLDFYQNGSEHVLVGNNWTSTNWSTPVSSTDLLPVTPIVLHEWHTMVERVDYSSAGNATVTIWLDPDFTKTEAAQPNSPVVVSANNTFDTIYLRAGNENVGATFSNITMAASSAGVGFVAPADPQFQNLVPGANDPSAAVGSPISAQIVFGTYGISTNKVVLTLDGNLVAPSFTVVPGSMTINYQPLTPFITNSTHTVNLSVTDSNNTPYSINWSFTVDSYPTLPITLAGPFDVSATGDGLGIQIFGSTNGWIAANYQSDSTNTLYTRFSMVFYDVNGETPGNGAKCFGGLQFFENGNERLITGQSWNKTTWSLDTKSSEMDLLPVTEVVAGEWHTIVIKNVYASNALTAETIWLDPDFSKAESQQASPLTFTMDNRFNSVRLRCGNGTAFAEYTNVVIAATAPQVGFAAEPVASLLHIQNSGGVVSLSWTGAGTLQTAPTVSGTWTDADNQTNPQTINAINAASFYRLKQ